MYLIHRFSAVDFPFTRCAVYLLLRLGNASLSIVLQITFLRKFPHSYRPVYVFMNFCHSRISGTYSGFALCESILWLSGRGIAIGIIWKMKRELVHSVKCTSVQISSHTYKQYL